MIKRKKMLVIHLQKAKNKFNKNVPEEKDKKSKK